MRTVSAIVLAAGLSRRMGRFKPLVDLCGRPLIRHALDPLLAEPAIAPIIVVTGHQHERLDQQLPPSPRLRAIYNAWYANGEMLSSIQVGLQLLPPDATHFLLALGDQPNILPATLATLLAAAETSPAPVIIPTYGGKRGHPLVFASNCVAEIRSLGSRETLRTVVERHTAEIHLVGVDDEAIIADVDTPEDLDRAAELHVRRFAAAHEGSR